MPARRRAGWLALFGVSVGAVAAATAALGNAGLCSDDAGQICRDLVRTLSWRIGIVTAAFTVLLTLLGMGLSRVASEAEDVAGRDGA